MYAVLKIGGKQYKVEEGQEIIVEKEFDEIGKSVTLKPLVISDDGKLDISGKGSVKITIVEETKGPKVIAFKYKPKKGYAKKIGHRQKLVKIKIEKITKASEKKKASGETTAKPKEEKIIKVEKETKQEVK